MKSLVLAFALSCSLAALGCGGSSSKKPMTEAGEPAAAAAADIVDTAVAAGDFTTLVKAVQEAGLVDTLKGPGPFTVFAPTDAAFARLPAGTIEALLADKEKLTAVLTYHVVSGAVSSADAAGLTTAKTVQGADLNITSADGSVKINDATVVKADIKATNGVIHVIDTVLPPARRDVSTGRDRARTGPLAAVRRGVSGVSERLVTGQNPASAAGVAEAMAKFLATSPDRTPRRVPFANFVRLIKDDLDVDHARHLGEHRRPSASPRPPVAAAAPASPACRNPPPLAPPMRSAPCSADGAPPPGGRRIFSPREPRSARRESSPTHGPACRWGARPGRSRQRKRSAHHR